MKFLVVLFIVLYSYAAIRYHFGKELGLSALLYVFNKAVAWWCASVLLLSLFSVNKLQKLGLSKRATGLCGYAVALCHILLTIFILSPTFYPRFYSGGILNMHGWISITLGILSILLFSFPLLATVQDKSQSWYYTLGRYGIILNISHVFSIGFLTWFPLTDWPMYLPPITLIFVFQGLLVLLSRHLKFNY